MIHTRLFSARSHFRSCIDAQLLRKHNLITPEDFSTEEAPVVPAPQGSLIMETLVFQTGNIFIAQLKFKCTLNAPIIFVFTNLYVLFLQHHLCQTMLAIQCQISVEMRVLK